MTLEGGYAEQLRDRSQRRELAALNQPGLRLAAAAGIGNPSRFFGMLKAAGLSIAELPLPDHHDYTDRPFARLQADIILMTEKDAVKCAQIEELRDDPRLWVVPVTARIDAALSVRRETSMQLQTSYGPGRSAAQRRVALGSSGFIPSTT